MKIRECMEELSFARRLDDETLDLWDVRSSGQHTLDYQLGCRYADEYIRLVDDAGAVAFLPHIVQAMVRKGGPCSIRDGFMSRIEGYIDHCFDLRRKFETSRKVQEKGHDPLVTI